MKNHHHPLTLFIVKKLYHYEGHRQVSNGLRHSAEFVVDMLRMEGHRAILEEAIDGNCVDRIVTQHRPARVVIEALWVTPSKLTELRRLHPSVKWTIRVHSEVPFLANEGSALEFIAAYLKMGVTVAFNSAVAVDDFSVLGDVKFLPNFYPLRKSRHSKPVGAVLDVGCFGAIRPLKNQLEQAFGAVRFAKSIHKRLRFHVNGSRIEQSGGNNLRQIRTLMKETGNELVIHPWLDHEAFLELIAMMDICLQVSLSESFNIVSADAVSIGVPLVGSTAIGWLPKRSQAAVDSSRSIAEVMRRADKTMVEMNHEALDRYLQLSVNEWMDWIK